MPALVDIDQDGDLDLVVGFNTGTLRLYRNTGSTTSPSFTEETTANPFAGAYFGNNAVPTFSDLDADGDSDLVLGTQASSSGNISLRYYRNTSIKNSNGQVSQIQFEGTQSGLLGEYFNNTDRSGTPVLSRIDPGIAFDWKAGSPGVGIQGNNFGARWTGRVQAPITGRYTFYVTQDDGARLTVNNQVLLNNLVNTSTTSTSQTIDLVAGQFYPIQLDYFENSGDARIKLEWQVNKPGFLPNTLSSVLLSRQLVGANYLQPAETSPNPLLTITGISNAIPTLADLDGDGRSDLIVKDAGGSQVRYFQNTSTPGTVQFTEITGSNNPLITLTSSSINPSFVDLNRDQSLDLFLGNLNNQYTYRLNEEIDQVQAGEIKPGETTGIINIRPINDSSDLPSQQIGLTLRNGDNYRLGTQNSLGSWIK